MVDASDGIIFEWVDEGEENGETMSINLICLKFTSHIV